MKTLGECLGIDLGNVIIDHLGFGTTPEFFESGDYNLIPPVPGVIEAVGKLNRERFNGTIFVVYKATDVADEKILAWMKAHDFYNQTGIREDQVRRTRYGRDKSSVCAEYKATHFIDDRLEVLGYLVNKVKHLYLFRPQKAEVSKFKQSHCHVRQVQSWDELLKVLLP